MPYNSILLFWDTCMRVFYAWYILPTHWICSHYHQGYSAWQQGGLCHLTHQEACNPRVIVPSRLSRKKAIFCISLLCTSWEPLYPQPLHASLVSPPPPNGNQTSSLASHLTELVSPWFRSISGVAVHQPAFLSPQFLGSFLRCSSVLWTMHLFSL